MEEDAPVVPAEAVPVHDIKLAHAEASLTTGVILVHVGTEVAECWIGFR
jgi:hypothetical protein